MYTKIRDGIVISLLTTLTILQVSTLWHSPVLEPAEGEKYRLTVSGSFIYRIDTQSGITQIAARPDKPQQPGYWSAPIADSFDALLYELEKDVGAVERMTIDEIIEYLERDISRQD